MSEYQYYEFRAIDCPLTEDQKADVSALSSRAYVTSHTASFVYHYGDFRGSVNRLMTDYFDAMLYMANWGSRRLMFRLPGELIDMEAVGIYCVSREIKIKETEDQKNVIVNIDFCDENISGWTEGEGWLDHLVKLRSQFMQGDFRGLYLAWLKAAEGAFNVGNIAGDTLEPPVPPGLRNLSLELKTFVEFLEIDEALIAVAAEKSKRIPKAVNLEPWINRLPSSEQYEFLVRLSRGERNLSIIFNKRLGELANEARPQNNGGDTQRRTISALLESSEVWRQKKMEEERREAELAREREMEALATKKQQIWQEVETLIEEKKIKSYDKAVELLQKLHDLAEYQGELEEFINRVARIQQRYSNRPGLLSRIGGLKIRS